MSSSRSRMFRSFDSGATKIIFDALSFVRSRIEKHVSEKKMVVDKVHHNMIDEEIKEVVQRIEAVENFLKEHHRQHRWMSAEDYEFLMDTVRSALDIYLRDTLEAKVRSGLDVFDRKVAEIEKVITHAGLKDRKTNLYDEYYEQTPTSSEGEDVEVFFSYSHTDRVLAGKIAFFLTDKGIDVFLAHENIEVSEEWREEIFKRLRSCNVLLALLTPNYEKSVWANQEAGFMRAKERKIIPLIIDGIDIKRFGFLEALQGIPVEEKNLDNSLEDILHSIFRS